jgi:hypothetical protein
MFTIEVAIVVLVLVVGVYIDYRLLVTEKQLGLKIHNMANLLVQLIEKVENKETQQVDTQPSPLVRQPSLMSDEVEMALYQARKKANKGYLDEWPTA